ncbi:glycerate kinase, partial [Clostridium tyrobutyricum]
DKNLAHYANIIKNNLNMDIVNIPGSGAAGGLGAGVMVFLNSNLKRGIDIVIDITKLDEKIKDADLIFTGEGMIDFQTAFGKTPFGVAKVADKYGIPVLAIAGGIGKNAETLYNKGFESIFSIVDKPMSLEDAMKNGKMLIEKTSERIMRILNI